ncbi:MAG: hypothetical protein HKN12_00280 [Gemmatimonadetes bacterium]|nr:hypothetical protein [Gemmatimonadota bacterium]
MNRKIVLGSVLSSAVLLGGCLGEPPVEERFTLLEIVDAGPTDAGQFTIGSGTPVTMNARITYRELLTGFLVAELRASGTLTADDTGLEVEDDHEAKARDVDLILRNSVAVGTDTVPITGWDHLVQEVSFSFSGGNVTPTAADSSSAAANANAAAISASGLFLVLYFSDNVEEVELASGEEIEVVTPVFSDERDILSTGLEIVPAPQE